MHEVAECLLRSSSVSGLHVLGVLVPARKIPDAVCRREGPCGPPPSEGDEPPPYRHPANGIFIRCGDRERS